MSDDIDTSKAHHAHETDREGTSERVTTKQRKNVSAPIVRPFGYVADRPIIRRIGDRDLYLGNGRAADSEYHDRTFEYVLSATQDEYPLTTHHRPLIDDAGNDWSAFERVVDTARILHRRDGSLLIHCKAGISRSSTLVATALAAEEGRRFNDSLDIVQNARPHACPNPALHKLAVVYLAAQPR